MSSRSCLIINPSSEADMEKQPNSQPSNLEQAGSSLINLGVTQISKFNKVIHIQGYRIHRTDENEGILVDVYINAANLERKPLLPSKEHTIAMTSMRLYTLVRYFSLVLLGVKKKSKSSTAGMKNHPYEDTDINRESIGL